MSRRVLITSQDAQARWRHGGAEALALGLGNIMSRVQPRVSICRLSRDGSKRCHRPGRPAQAQ